VVAVENRVITAIKYALDKEGINIPFPIRIVFFHDETKHNKDPEAYANGTHSRSSTPTQKSAA
jgi:small-conductance mechanosensitive channel